MYVELNPKQAKLVTRYLEDKELPYSSEQVQLDGMKTPIIHFNLDQIPKEDLDIIKDIIDNNMLRERRVRKWDQKYHTISEEAAGWFTGKNTEEEVVRE